MGSAAGTPTPRITPGEKEEASFSLVIGHVRVLKAEGKSRKAATGKAVQLGESVQTGPDSEATLKLPDGSSLDLSANTRVTVASLSQPSSQDKNFRFQLAVGKLFAQVRKLLSSKSSFEIEAGGVVCGVRGTQFSMNFDPGTKNLDLNVFEGKVGAAGGGFNQLFSQGQAGHFLSGHWDGKISSAGSPPKVGGNGGKGSSGGSTGTGSGVSGGTNGGTSGGTNGGNSNEGGTDNSTGSPAADGDSSNGGDNSTGGSNTTNTNGNPLQTSCLGDLNNQFLGGILINGDNNLNAAQQSVRIHLVVPPGEAVP